MAHDVLAAQPAFGQLFVAQGSEKFNLAHPRLRCADGYQKVKNAAQHSVHTDGDAVALWDV